MMDSQREKHKILVDLENNPKKRSKFSNAQIAEIKNRLYFYDVAFKKEPYQYKQETPHIYKNYKILRPYQTESVNWLIKSWYEKRNTLLADEMGLGKTIQSIAFLYHLFNFENVKGPFLVIAPLSTLEHWKRTV
jgi:chromodomain-helicase-DNA-binding protein 7